MWQRFIEQMPVEAEGRGINKKQEETSENDVGQIPIKGKRVSHR